VTNEELKLLERAEAALSGSVPLLDGINWGREVEDEFFARRATRLPEPSYTVDRDRLTERLRALDGFERELVGDDALVSLLRLRVASQRLGAELLLAVGTRRFGELSNLAFGGARSSMIDHDTTNLEFADHLAERIYGDEEGDPPADTLTGADLVADFESRLAKARRAPQVEIVLDPRLSAKVVAGRSRVRVRPDATFSAEEARSLYLHEVETHVFTAQNGRAQPRLSLLDSGGPLTTRTQEGLAVFSEVYSKALTVARLRRLVQRVHLVADAEEGADFLDLYRDLLTRGVPERAAFGDVARIFRGGIVAGGSAFTKDACYLAGFSEVYNVLRLAIRAKNKVMAEVLVSGRLSLEEMPHLLALREDGVLEPPEFVPSWLRRWDDLVLYFAFSSFLQEVDLKAVQRRHPWVGEGTR
jgi:uncharacterized protein (TIGR02421 family)